MIFVDTGAWYARYVVEDIDHPAAVAWFNAPPDRLLTTDYIIDELAEWAGIALKDPTPAMLDAMYQLSVHAAPESDELFEWLNANRAEDAEVADRANELEAFRQSIDSTDQ